MNSFTKENYMNKLKDFQPERWDSLSKYQKEKLLQWIVDYEAKQLGLNSICVVKIDQIKGNTKSGEFDPKNKQITIEEDLALNGLKPPYHIPKIQNKNLTREYDTYGTLMHEFRHAFQLYVKQHPKQFNDKEYFKIIMYNTNDNNNSIYSYFDVNMKNIETNLTSNVLYRIQPIERDAFMFQERKLRTFAKDMHILFPEQYPDWYSSKKEFERAVENAKSRYQTETPFKDIDNIIKTMNGESITCVLNEQIIQDIKETQQKPIIQQIKGMLFEKEKQVDLDELVDINNDFEIKTQNENDIYKEMTDESYEELYR